MNKVTVKSAGKSKICLDKKAGSTAPITESERINKIPFCYCSNCGEEHGTGFFDRDACLFFCKLICVTEYYGNKPRHIKFGAAAAYVLKHIY